MTKNFFYKRVIGLFVVIILLFSCKSNFKNKDEIIKSNKFSTILQFLIEKNQIQTIEEELIETHCNNWSVYQSLVPTYLFKSEITENSDTISSKLLSVVKNYMIYIQKDGDSIGYELDSTNMNIKNTLSVIAFKKRHAFLNFSNFYNTKTDSLFTTQKFKDSMVETYISKSKIDLSYPDSMYFSYWNNKKNETNFSFSKELEAKHNKWLYQIEMIYDSIPPKNKSEQGIPRHIYKYCITDTLVNKMGMQELVQVIENTKNKGNSK